MPHKPAEAPADIDVSPVAAPDPETPGPRGRGAARKETQPTAAPKKRARKHKPEEARTIYLPDALFERVLIQAKRRKLTISEYVALMLGRHVPDHRTIRTDPPGEAGAA